MSNQRLGVNQLLGVTPNRWPTNFFLGFSSWISHEPLVRMMEKVLFHHFPMFFIIFDHANSCASMHLLVEIHNKCCNLENEKTIGCSRDMKRRLSLNNLRQLPILINLLNNFHIFEPLFFCKYLNQKKKNLDILIGCRGVEQLRGLVLGTPW